MTSNEMSTEGCDTIIRLTDPNGSSTTVELEVSSGVLRTVAPTLWCLINTQKKKAAVDDSAVSVVSSADMCEKTPTATPVSSKALSIAETEEEHGILELPEDDASAMTLFMNLVHFRISDIFKVNGGDGIHKGLSSPELLEKLAHVCVKYECARPVQFLSHTWIEMNLEELKKNTDMEKRLTGTCRLLVFAYVTDQPQAFFDLAWQIISLNNGPIVNNTTTDVALPNALMKITAGHNISVPEKVLKNHALLPDGLLDIFEMRRLACCKRFHECQVDAMRTEWQVVRTYGAQSGYYMAKALDTCLPVCGYSYPDQSVDDLLVEMDRIVEGEKDFDQKKLNGYYSKVTRSSLVKSREYVTGKQDALTCLDCIRTLGKSHKAHKCRVSH